MAFTNCSTGGKPTNADIVARDRELQNEQEKKRLANMTPEQRERERLYFAEKRRAATAEYFAAHPQKQ
jgi:hypothetical protein